MSGQETHRPSSIHAAEGASAPAAAEAPRRINVADLLGDENEIVLVHNGADYRLRLTAANRLILKK